MLKFVIIFVGSSVLLVFFVFGMLVDGVVYVFGMLVFD